MSLALYLACGLVLGYSQAVIAGGGPEGVLLVVNANSDASKEVANHYVRLRNIPAGNILYLDYKGARELARGDDFREMILDPVLKAINQRGLAVQIDTIAYSCDFPWRIDFSNEFNESVKFSKQLKPIASITGATYLWQFVLSKSPALVTPSSNRYLPATPNPNVSKCVSLGQIESQGFRGRYFWNQGGERAKEVKGSIRYFMSTMLGVTTGRGNSVEEVVESLKRSAYADSNPPQGAFYFMKNRDVRSKTRDLCFGQAANTLRALGAEAVVAEGTTPPKGSNVIGLMTGTAKFSADGLNIAPGAICEHLTSSGGELRTLAGQTPLSEWIRSGASGACGTVAEPFAIQAKFPLPSLPIHYRRGCSLAEAFYQSVSSPYQLLIVGDPLCQPWAQRPQIKVEGWPSEEPMIIFEESNAIPAIGEEDKEQAVVSVATLEEQESELAEEQDGEQVLLKLSPFVTPAQGSGAAFWELFIDGKLLMRMPSGTPISIHKKGVRPGWHELRCVGSNPDRIETQERVVGAFELRRSPFEEKDFTPVTINPQSIVADFDGDLTVRCLAPGEERIAIFQHSRQVGLIEGESGTVNIAGKTLGRGPVRLHAISAPNRASSAPVWVLVK